ncbi:MAG: RICIN domain-containing protein [Paludibacteraceae bacterium]|nr:RICIN domain-containing protein [Paludibacteraceae bacterium]
MKRAFFKIIIKLTFTIMLLMALSSLSAQSVNIVKGTFKSERDNKLLKIFAVSKGDVINIKMNSLHKRNGVDIGILQHPGKLLVFDFQDAMEINRNIIAPADAIYEVYYGGHKVDFNIEISNNSSKPNGPGRGEIVYVRMPDTVHVSGYVNRPIGESYKLTPYKEKVILNSVVVTEPVANRDFITGSDKMNLYIQGDVKDEYREQKLLSYNVSLIVDAPSSYAAITGVVKAGMDAFIPDLSPTKFLGKGKSPKMNPNNMYEVVKDANKEKERLEKAVQSVQLAQELGDSLRPGKSSNADKILETTGFLLDTDGMKQMALNKGLKAVGASNEVMAIADKVMNIPSATDFLKSGLDKYASKIKGKATLVIREPRLFKEPIYSEPDPNKKYLIQSAMNRGKDAGAYWDLPGDNNNIKKGQNIQIWDYNNGIDRQFAFKKAGQDGFYEIVVGNMSNARIDVAGGKSGNGVNLQVWEANGSAAQRFRLKHMGEGRFKIYDVNDRVICTDGRKNSKGTNVHMWDDHDGPWTEWVLIDVTTGATFIPQNTGRTLDIWRDVDVFNQTGGAINHTVNIANENDPINTNLPYKEVKLHIKEKDYVADAKLIVEAKYKITDYTDVVKYRKVSEPVHTKDFWTAYKVNYDYAIMFKDQAREYYEIISSSDYFNTNRPLTEFLKRDDEVQKTRLEKYNILTGTK